MRFLRALKGTLREAVAVAQDQEGITQEQFAERLGFDPAQLSRLLSTDRHNTTKSLFRAMYRLRRRWTFGSVPLPVSAKEENRPVESSDQPPPAVRVSDFFATTDGASPQPTSPQPSGTRGAGATNAGSEKSVTALAVV